MDNRSAGLRQYYVGVGTVDAKLPTLVELLQALRVDTRLALAVACSSRDAVDAVVHALASCSGFNIAVLHSDLELHEMEQQVMQIKRRLQRPSSAPQQQQQQQQQQHSEGVQQTVQDALRSPLQQQADHQHQQQQPAPPAVVAARVAQPPLPAAAAGASAAVHTDHPAPALPLETSTVLPAADWTDSRSLVLVTTDICLKYLSRELLPLGLPLLIQYDLPANKDALVRRLAAVFGSSKERGRKAGRQVVIDFVAAGEVAAFRARERLSSAPVMEMPVHVPDIFC